MRLGDALWKIGLPEEEKSRISKALADESSINFKIFTEYYKGQQQFDVICHKMVRKIPGFRPTAEPYRKRVHAEVLKSLRNNNAKLDFWHLYTGCVAEFVISNLSALNQLLADTELPLDFEPTTEGIISEITDRAGDYSVHDRDVSVLYELWPFERLPNMPDYLAKCPKFDRFRALDESIRSIETRLAREISYLKQHTTDDVADIQNSIHSKVVAKSDFKEAMQANKQEVTQALGAMTRRIDALDEEKDRVQKLARRLEARRTTEFRNLETEQTKEFDKLHQSINQLKNEQERISEIVEDMPSSSSERTPLAVTPNEARRSPFSLLEQIEDTDDLEKLSVKDGLARFVGLTGKGQSEPPGNEELFFYTALLTNCILVVDQPELNIWQSVVGWNRHKVTVCASPLWVDEFAISDSLFWLFDEPEEPRCLEIHDFDLGYVEGYLGPFLKAWSRSAVHLPWKKIHLIPSGATWSVSRQFATLVSVLPKIDFANSVLSGNAKLEQSVVPPFRVRKFMKQHGVTGHWDTNEQDSIGELESTGVGPSAAELVQTRIISSTPLPNEITNKFASELGVFWSGRCGE